MPDNETRNRIGRWVGAQNRVDRARGELTKAECELANARDALGAHLTPEDAKPGEVFNIWVEGNLLTVTFSGLGTFKIGWRKGKE